MLKRTLKLLHEVSGIGVLGSLACYLVLAATAPDPWSSLGAYAAVRMGIVHITKIILVPSLAVVLISGLLSIAANRAFHDAGWAWFKALLGVSMFEGTLLTAGAASRHAAQLAAMASSNAVDAIELTRVLQGESGTLWLLTALSLGNVILGVYRPRLSFRPRTGVVNT